MNDDMTLVREFAASHSESAFATLVDRHIGLVHAAALRQVADPHLAQEITQAVFIILARKAASLGSDTILSAWLYRTTRYAASDTLKSQRRRQSREQEAYMQSTLTQSDADTWNQLAPQLDDAMAELGETDRAALILRYFENKSAREIAERMRLAEPTAQKRITRALEKLRTIFVKRGTTLTVTAIASAVAANSVSAAPVGLSATVTAAALHGAVTGSSTLALVKGALKIMTWTKIRTGLAVSTGLFLMVVTTTTLVLQLKSRPTPVVPPVATLLDLTAHYTTAISNFDKITPFPAFKTVARGAQTFNHVPLFIGGMICLWGEGNFTKFHDAEPEQINGINVGQKFEALYVYHASFFKSNPGTPVCNVVFRYSDGSSSTNAMLYDDDFIDWVSDASPTGPNSAIAWVGGRFSPANQHPLRLVLTSIDNPEPALEVTHIDLYSCKSRTEACIMAMSVGRSGLMQ